MICHDRIDQWHLKKQKKLEMIKDAEISVNEFTNKQGWNYKWTEHESQNFENIKCLQTIKSDPIRLSACAIDAKDVTSFLDK